MSFGERLKLIRKTRGITQCKLSKISGISTCVLSLYENGKAQPTVDRIEWICKSLNVTATELLGF